MLLGLSSCSLSSLYNPVTYLSFAGMAHNSIFADLPLGVKMSNSNPAFFKCNMGINVSTGWLPVENFFPFVMARLDSSVQITKIRCRLFWLALLKFTGV